MDTIWNSFKNVISESLISYSKPRIAVSYTVIVEKLRQKSKNFEGMSNVIWKG